MNPFSFGSYYRFTLFGGSHEPAVGAVIEGLPPGALLDEEALRAFLARRAPGRQSYASSRREEDIPLFEQGLSRGRFTGEPLVARIPNRDARPEDYRPTRFIPRPGHADWPAYMKTGAIPPGGGHFSGRLTAAYCLAGGIALQQLSLEGIRIRARVQEIGGASREEDISARLEEARSRGDSLGGVVSCEIQGLPVGLGDHPFQGLENRLAQALFAIPAVKGLEFGDGFALASMRGSQANDPYRMEEGRVVLSSNHAGGLLGGMATGAPLIFRLAFKPAPSIALPQESVDLSTGHNTILKLSGRHDSCFVPRAVPVAEAAAAAALYDALLESRAQDKEGELPALRRRIDAADRQIVRAFRERMEAAAQIGALKKARGIPVYDPAREEALLEGLEKSVRLSCLQEKEGEETPALARDLRALYRTILELSKQRQELRKH